LQTYEELASDASLDMLVQMGVVGIGPFKGNIMPINASTNFYVGAPNDLVTRAHNKGLEVSSLSLVCRSPTRCCSSFRPFGTLTKLMTLCISVLDIVNRVPAPFFRRTCEKRGSGCLMGVPCDMLTSVPRPVQVHPYTFRADSNYLAADLHGDFLNELLFFDKVVGVVSRANASFRTEVTTENWSYVHFCGPTDKCCRSQSPSKLDGRPCCLPVCWATVVEGSIYRGPSA
jgi:hypothetical protein